MYEVSGTFMRYLGHRYLDCLTVNTYQNIFQFDVPVYQTLIM